MEVNTLIILISEGGLTMCVGNYQNYLCYEFNAFKDLGSSAHLGHYSLKILFIATLLTKVPTLLIMA